MKRRVFCPGQFLLAILFILFVVGAWFSEADAAPADLESLQRLVQDLQMQLATFHRQVEAQSEMIQVQGKEIAALKNRLEGVPEKGGTVYVPPGGEEAFKQSVRDVVQELRLSEREEIPEEKQLLTLYDDGFYLKGKDDTLRIGGWYQGDVSINDRGNETADRFRNRRVRLDFRGVLEDVFEYRLFPQFAGSTANLQEAWLEYKYFPNARVRFGQVKVPFSLESQYSSLWTDFVEKSIGVANLEPAEDLGLMLFGKPFGGLLEYAVGTFNGRARTLEDNNDNFDVGGRFVLQPFMKSPDSLLRDLYVGSSAMFGHSDETLTGTGFTTASGNRFLTYASSTRHSDQRVRLGGELQWIYGPGDIKAEYVTGRFEDVDRLELKDDVRTNSWYASASYVLTGERKPRNKPLIPKKIFSVADGNWGAWEAAIRFEQFLVNDSPFDLGLATGTDRVDGYTAGLNWWPNKHIRLMLDYTYNDFSGPVLIGSETEDSEHLLLGRVQYNF